VRCADATARCTNLLFESLVIDGGAQDLSVTIDENGNGDPTL
jgi:hypothetical protein